MPAGASPVTVTLAELSLARGPNPVLVDVDLTITGHSRLAVVGRNGIGKSTLLSVLAGALEPDAGRRIVAPPTASAGLLRQQLDRSTEFTGRDLLRDRTGVAQAQIAFDAATDGLAAGTPGADLRYDLALATSTRTGAFDFDARVELTAAEVGLAPEVLDRPTAVLSGGEASRIGLMLLLLSRHDIALLDEPTNDLDTAGLTVLEAWVNGFPGGIVVVSHDRWFLERTVSSVLEIHENVHTVSLFHGGWDAFTTDRAVARSHAERDHANYVDERDRLRRRAQTQREWAAQGAARAKKNPADGDKFIKARNVAQTEKLAGKASATERAAERLEVVEKPWVGWDLRFSIAAAERSGKVVAALDEAVIARGSFRLGPLDVEIRYGERVAIAGANGTGKSTLIDALLGRVEITTGRHTLGTNVEVGELDQHRRRFDDGDQSLLSVFCELADHTVNQARSVLAKFAIDAETVDRSARLMSPGERTRAQLALFQARGVNLLILDEPTNHLDLPAIEQLEEALTTYEGTLILVTHDRRFRDAVEIDRTITLRLPRFIE